MALRECGGSPLVRVLRANAALQDAGLRTHRLAHLVVRPQLRLAPSSVCLRCGALGGMRPVSLHRECPTVAGAAGRKVLEALSEGRVPRHPGARVTVLQSPPLGGTASAS